MMCTGGEDRTDEGREDRGRPPLGLEGETACCRDDCNELLVTSGGDCCMTLTIGDSGLCTVACGGGDT